MKLFRKKILTINLIIIFLGLANFAKNIANAQETSKGEIISPPTGFEYKPDFKIYRGNGKPLGAKISFDPNTKSDIGAKTTYYVNIATGKNSNDGLTKERPFKSLWCALQKKGSKNVIIEKGRYDFDDGWKGIASTDALAIKSNGGATIISTHKNDTSKRGWSSERNAQVYFHNTDFS